ncbi:uncharacterized protein LOC143462811 [Clavelina lepadiformis]|uniref:uncharacterized protein LOC143462811 n=1 Tax=Clavelina lepadiformis TaxID=159417 RepID=UPI004042B315
MKLNFSIDFILGSCGQKSNPDDRRTRVHTDVTSGINRNYTVKWKPPENIINPKPEKSPIFGQFSSSDVPEYCFPGMTSQCHVAIDVRTSCPEAGYKNQCQSPPFLGYLPTSPAAVTSSSSTKPLPTYDNSYNAFSPHNLSRYPNLLPSSASRRDIKPEHKPSSEESRHDSKPVSEKFEPQTANDTNAGSDNSTISEEKSSQKLQRQRIGRKLFTGFQILELEKAFSSKPYLTRPERIHLSTKVNLTECQIKTWFQNRRTKEKRRGPCSDDDDVTSVDGVTSSEPYRPKAVRIPGHGIQVRATYGPPDRHLKAAILDLLKRKTNETISEK